ncbi:ERBB receptor feedback inhibitor 1 isoform X1 [Boleophthalmus pectinirostris]|uniref:ERBB receptor feedback inhibitor 1 isoform X1 n=1 Tax=Boleophthalmus pectinirostris TaxID=150288 RepID=UPI00242A7687|nr:ERBB receptor feedback inhibitor 1 isoform X1 [Boleophthalmus pectinirostris]
MAGNENNLWGQHGLSRDCFGLDMDHNLRGLHKDFASLSHPPYFSDAYLASQRLLRPPQEGDQVVPSAQRGCTVLRQRASKPLPPLPDPEELMSDEAADQEVEFFTSDRRCLLPKSFPKAPCKGSSNVSSRHNGQVNYAYQDASLLDKDSGNMAFSWPGCDDRLPARGSHFPANNWDNGDAFWGKPDDLTPKMRFSCSVPPIPDDKPEVPPRIPIKPKNLTFSNDDKPPKIPPRVPLVPPCPPRTPSPKSLPIYINGVMPPTQSFAANPNYVSKTLQRHHSERVPSTTQSSPCIVPILKDGRQASTTHYILLPPGAPASSNRRDRLQSEPTRKSNGGFWKKR